MHIHRVFVADAELVFVLSKQHIIQSSLQQLKVDQKIELDSPFQVKDETFFHKKIFQPCRTL